MVWLSLFIVEEKLLVGLHLSVPRHLSLLDLYLGGGHSAAKLKHSIITHIARHWPTPEQNHLVLNTVST